MGNQLAALLQYAVESGVEERDRSIALRRYAEGKDIARIAEEFGLGTGGVRYILNSLERKVTNYLSWRMRIVDECLLGKMAAMGLPPLKEKVIVEYAEGSSFTAIAAMHALTAVRVRSIIEQFLRHVDQHEQLERAAALRLRIGGRLRQERMRLHMTTVELAAQVGLSERTIQRYEAGKIKNAGAERLLKIAGVLGVPLDAL